jgi:hypothetical protein
MAGYFINSLFRRRIIEAPPAFRKAYHRTKLFSRLASKPSALISVSLLLVIADHKIIFGFVSDNISDLAAFVGKLF